MALMHPDATKAHTNPGNLEMMASTESIIELAKNMISPVKCDWGTGAKAECGVLLGSWTLFRKHLHYVHCHKTKDGFVCALPKCNQQFHPTLFAFAEHLDSAHLSRLTLCCPVSDCKSGVLRGLESLQKHYEEQHSDVHGKPLCHSVDPSMTWEPITCPFSLANGPTSNTGDPGCLELPVLPSKSGVGLGGVLVPQIGMRRSSRIAEWLQGDSSNGWLSSQPAMAQHQGFMSSQGTQGVHQIMSRKRTRIKQLEKVKEPQKLEEDEEGVTKIILDDLTKFDAEGNLVDLAGQRRGVIMRGSPNEHGDDRLVKKADRELIIGQRLEQFWADLSRPQPLPVMMSERAMSRGIDDPASAHAIRGMTFAVMARKMDKLPEDKQVDPMQLLHDFLL